MKQLFSRLSVSPPAACKTYIKSLCTPSMLCLCPPVWVCPECWTTHAMWSCLQEMVDFLQEVWAEEGLYDWAHQSVHQLLCAMSQLMPSLQPDEHSREVAWKESDTMDQAWMMHFKMQLLESLPFIHPWLLELFRCLLHRASACRKYGTGKVLPLQQLCWSCQNAMHATLVEHHWDSTAS